jgi:hypothetical protein
MTSALETLVGRPVMNVFRRAEIRRRLATTGKLESAWTDVSEFVKRWGSFELAVDDIRLNRFTHGGLSLVVRNDSGKFNPESNGNSLWNGYLTRYKSLVRIQAGYLDEDRNELPTDTTQGVYVLSDEIPISVRSNEATLNCLSLVSIFDEVRAVEVPGLGAAQSASDIIARIRDHSDGSGNLIFREFITSTSWTIQTTTAQYTWATSGSLANVTCWELMSKLAEAEGFVVLVNRSGGLEFRNRDERAVTPSFYLNGQGTPEMNIIGLDETVEPLDRLFNFFRLKYLQDDTSTSFVYAGTMTTVDPSSSAWKYGNRIYDFEGDFYPNTAAAQAVVDNLRANLGFVTPKQDVSLVCKFLPSVEILDRVAVTYQSFAMNGVTLWDFFDWDLADWDSEFGENVNWTQKPFKVARKVTDLDSMTTRLKLQEL